MHRIIGALALTVCIGLSPVCLADETASATKSASDGDRPEIAVTGRKARLFSPATKLDPKRLAEITALARGVTESRDGGETYIIETNVDLLEEFWADFAEPLARMPAGQRNLYSLPNYSQWANTTIDVSVSDELTCVGQPDDITERRTGWTVSGKCINGSNRSFFITIRPNLSVIGRFEMGEQRFWVSSIEPEYAVAQEVTNPGWGVHSPSASRDNPTSPASDLVDKASEPLTVDEIRKEIDRKEWIEQVNEKKRRLEERGVAPEIDLFIQN